MKSLVATIVVMVILGISSCEKENDHYKYTGTISGRDFTMCACCGGWIFFIDSVSYEFDSIPSNSNINLEDEILPIAVKLDWQLITNGCPIKRITVQRIKKV